MNHIIIMMQKNATTFPLNPENSIKISERELRFGLRKKITQATLVITHMRTQQVVNQRHTTPEGKTTARVNEYM